MSGTVEKETEMDSKFTNLSQIRSELVTTPFRRIRKSKFLKVLSYINHLESELDYARHCLTAEREIFSKLDNTRKVQVESTNEYTGLASSTMIHRNWQMTKRGYELTITVAI